MKVTYAIYFNGNPIVEGLPNQAEAITIWRDFCEAAENLSRSYPINLIDETTGEVVLQSELDYYSLAFIESLEKECIYD